MNKIKPYYLSPDIFDEQWAGENGIEINLQNIRDLYEYNGLFVDAANTKWSSYVGTNYLKINGLKYLLEKMKTDNRLINDKKALQNLNSIDDWIRAFLAEPDEEYVTVATKKAQNDVAPGNLNVQNVSTIRPQNDQKGVELKCDQLVGYFERVFKYSKWIEYIDPYCLEDPKNFIELVTKGCEYGILERIVVHTKLPQKRKVLRPEQEIELLKKQCCNTNSVKFELVIWENIHKRLILSSMGGWHLDHGLTGRYDLSQTISALSNVLLEKNCREFNNTGNGRPGLIRVHNL
jgi:hypothetical protein